MSEPAGEVILGRTLEELSALMASLGQPAYRAKQLRDGVMQASRGGGEAGAHGGAGRGGAGCTLVAPGCAAADGALLC